MTHNDKSIVGWALGLLFAVIAIYFMFQAAGRGWKGQKLVGKV